MSKTPTAGDIWQKLSAIDVSDHIEQKGNLSYLSWAWAWGVLMEHHPEAEYSFGEHEIHADGTVTVYCTVSIGACSRTMWLPVMDHRNKAIPNPGAFQMNTSKMRCLTKCLAMFGLGHYIYAGEDLPAAEQAKQSEPLNDDQWSKIDDLLTKTESDREKFAKAFGVDKPEDLTQGQLEKATQALEIKLNKMEQANASH